MFTSIISSISGTASSYTTNEVLLCSAASLALGLIISLVFYLQRQSSRSYRVTLIVLPLLVQSVIMMVDGNLGTSVAVLGAFGLVRFRSQPGNSKEICGVFFAMAVGLANAMGCIVFAGMLTLIVSIILLAAEKIHLFRGEERALQVTIPENLDYTDVFCDIFEEFTDKNELLRVKTTNMGSMFELRYKVSLKKGANEKAFLDQIRCKNGNLTVIFDRAENHAEEF